MSSFEETPSASSSQSSSSLTGGPLTAAAPPRILTRAAVPQLSEGLDAADILECYALVRPAPLHNAMLSDSTMTIHKLALGLRYRPLKLNDIEEEAKIREITLEYGPQRMGVDQVEDSMPSVHKEQEVGPDGAFSNNTDTSRSFLSWENEGKVYYTTQIRSAGYIGAYYMASVTGAVLGKILEKAVDYPMEHAFVRGRPRRYQPFVVVDGSTDDMPPPGFEGEFPDQTTRRTFIKSSGSSDFMNYMWHTLAESGVSLHPILAPPTYEVQLLASGVERLKVGPPDWVTQSAASFYEKLYTCLQAKVTGDYSRYVKPTLPPTTASPTIEPNTASSKGDGDGGDHPSHSGQTLQGKNTEGKLVSNSDEHDKPDDDDTGRRVLRADMPGTPEMKETDAPIDAIAAIESDVIQVGNTTTDDNNYTFTQDLFENGEQGNVTEWESGQSDSNRTFSSNSTYMTSPPTYSVAPSAAPSSHKLNPKDTKNEVDEAQMAADQAKQAAAEAKDAAKSDVDTKAADAAEAAANAAQKAADATSSAAAQAALDALQSGDGTSIISFLSPCLSDPQFGIAQIDENGTVATQAYLYLDGSSYYRLNLTAPYVQIVSVEQTLPQPRDFGGSGGGGDFVDWSLAMLILFMSLFGILMLIQQVLGGYVKLVQPLFDFQEWFFNPLHYQEIKESREEEQRLGPAGQGQAYSFGQDVIPVSMGGRRVGGKDLKQSANNFIRRTIKSPKRAHDSDGEDGEFEPLNLSVEREVSDGLSPKECEIEMTEARTPVRHNSFHDVQRRIRREESADSGNSSGIDVSDSSGGKLTEFNRIVGNMELVKSDDRIREKELPSRLSRDPDLVDMPNLRSTSKVAIPVGVKRNISFHSAGGNTL